MLKFVKYIFKSIHTYIKAVLLASYKPTVDVAHLSIKI